MAIQSDTTTGTITLDSGSTTFAASGVLLLTRGHRPGDTILRNGLSLVIETITSETAGTLRDPCPADAAGTAATRIRFQGDGSRVSAAARDLVEKLGNGNLESIAGADIDTGTFLVGAGPGVIDALPAADVREALGSDDAANLTKGSVPWGRIPSDITKSQADIAAAKYVQAKAWAGGAIDSLAWVGLEYSPELGRTIVIDSGGAIYRSDDGLQTLTACTVPGSGTLRTCQWFKELGRFIVVGDGRTLWSVDGIAWNEVIAPAGFWTNVAYSPVSGQLVAVNHVNDPNATNFGKIMTSGNGGNGWVVRNVPHYQDWLGVTYSEDLDLFVIHGSPMLNAGAGNYNTANKVMTSQDGINWTAYDLGNKDHWWNSIWVHELQKFVAVANNYSTYKFMTSPDGVNWTTRQSPGNQNWYDVAWSPELGMLVAVASGETAGSGPDADQTSYPAGTAGLRLAYSYDGETWFSWAAQPAAIGWRKVIWIPKLYFAAVASSGSGQRLITTAPARDFRPVSRNSGKFTCADDAVVKIPMPDPDGQTVLFSQSPGAPAGATQPSFIIQIKANQATAPAIMAVTPAASANVLTSTSALAGTTGTDAKLTIGCPGDGFLYFENRLGASRSWKWKCLDE
jgi:hypothetical protein